MFRRVLICDELKWSSTFLKQIIQKSGEYVVVEAEDLQQAMHLVEERKKEDKEFDFIIVSVEFNKTELFGFLEKVIEDGFEGEIAIAGAAGLGDEVIKRSLSLKVRKFLTKPYKESEVKNFL